MNKRVIEVLFAISLIFTLTGFNGEQHNPTVETPQDTASEKSISTPEMDEFAKSGALDTRRLVKQAIKDLAIRLNIQLNEISTVQVENVTWRDGSLGCPQKGTSYTQALVPGTLIILRADGAEHEYHAGSNGALSYCVNPEPPVVTAK